MEVSGKVDCVNFVASGSVTLGDGLADEIVINGHIRQEDITFDANSDGTALTLRFTDPTEPRIITFPEETGIVLTSTSAESALEIVGELTAGSIVPGFGSIVTTNNIETVGSGTITAGGQFTATSDIDCQGSVQLGDEAEDSIYVAGTVASGALHATTHLTTLPLDHQTTKLYPIMHEHRHNTAPSCSRTACVYMLCRHHFCARYGLVLRERCEGQNYENHRIVQSYVWRFASG